MTRDAIRSVIAQESPILYRDGQTRIGVFFSKEHREYIPFKDIPEAWVQAIVAAEDKTFWTHPGVDFGGIARAMKQNIAAGRMVAGGSSLTQQTAKNLFYRPDRSLKSKWKELVNALRLEAHYSKQDILEFYANQFHVNSNGRGLGIAARYFFDKEPADLSMLESAFIAGMVKAPSRYNPFIGSDERRARALKRAHARTVYVLDRMLAEGHLSAADHQALAAQEIPFKRGSFQYQSSSIVDEVEARLAQDPFPRVFHELGIDNPSTAGISIVTTLDADAQRSATYGLWHHLTEVGPLLEKQTATALLMPASSAPAPDAGSHPVVHGFYTGRVIDSATNDIMIDLQGSLCRIDQKAQVRIANVLARAKTGNKWAKGGQQGRVNLKATLAKGSVVRVSIRELGDPPLCDLELRPELQGAVMLLENGQIRAMVGGNDNKNFNRAVDAKRQLGSTWKPVLYLAAVQLGWAPTDALDNRPNAFQFSGGWYYPRADHKSEPWTSLSWAGTRSENLASIWLLAHLTDRLTSAQFQQIAADVDLVRRADEDGKAYVRRMQKAGVNGADSRMDEMVFTAAKHDVLTRWGHDLQASRELRSLSYGYGLDKERARVQRLGPSARERKETALRRTFRHLKPLSESCAVQARGLQGLIEAGRAAAAAQQVDSWGEPVAVGAVRPSIPRASEFSYLRARRGLSGLELACGRAPGDWSKVDQSLLQEAASGTLTVAGGLASMTVVDGVPSAVLQDLNDTIPRMRGLLSMTDAWDMQRLQYHPDYRLLVGMRYMDRLARTLGVQDKLPSVLSLPLGSVDLTLEEAATLYQGMMDLQTYTFPGKLGGPRAAALPSPSKPAQLILEIRDRDGAVLYSAQPVPRPVADAGAGRLVGDVLRNVVRWGTGRRALGKVKIGEVPVPLVGKTGTTNKYRNAAFAGFVPKASPEGWLWGNAYTLVTYVGYDDNRAMRRGGLRLQGSDGALPVWLSTAEGLAAAGLLGSPPEVPGSGFLLEPGEWAAPVQPGSGLQGSTWDVGEPGASRSVLIRTDASGVSAARSFTPVQP